MPAKAVGSTGSIKSPSYAAVQSAMKLLVRDMGYPEDLGELGADETLGRKELHSVLFRKCEIFAAALHHFSTAVSANIIHLRQIQNFCTNINMLPVEILTRILSIVIRTPQDKAEPVLNRSYPGRFGVATQRGTGIVKRLQGLARVCKAWLGIVIDSPSLWTALNLHTYPSQQELMIRRSQNAPVRIACGTGMGPTSHQDCGYFQRNQWSCEALVAIHHRWQSLNLCDAALHPFKDSLKHPLPHLQEAYLTVSEDNGILGIEAPNLRKLGLDVAQGLRFCPSGPLIHLTVLCLELSDPAPQDLLSLLVLCPAVQILSVTVIREEDWSLASTSYYREAASSLELQWLREIEGDSRSIDELDFLHALAPTHQLTRLKLTVKMDGGEPLETNAEVARRLFARATNFPGFEPPDATLKMNEEGYDTFVSIDDGRLTLTAFCYDWAELWHWFATTNQSPSPQPPLFRELPLWLTCWMPSDDPEEVEVFTFLNHDTGNMKELLSTMDNLTRLEVYASPCFESTIRCFEALQEKNQQGCFVYCPNLRMVAIGMFDTTEDKEDNEDELVESLLQLTRGRNNLNGYSSHADEPIHEREAWRGVLISEESSALGLEGVWRRVLSN